MEIFDVYFEQFSQNSTMIKQGLQDPDSREKFKKLNFKFQLIPGLKVKKTTFI